MIRVVINSKSNTISLFLTKDQYHNVICTRYVEIKRNISQGRMSDFSDEQDIRLFVLAKKYVDANERVSWINIERKMKSSRKSRVVLRERFRTLKRTHGDDLNKFPRRFFAHARGKVVKDSTPKHHHMTEDQKAVAVLLQLFAMFEDEH